MTQTFDSAWKEGIAFFFPAFLEFFFPQIHQEIDWTVPVRFLDKQLRKIDPDGKLGNRDADLLAEVTRRGGEKNLVLIYVEVQNQKDPHFAERMLIYHYRIYDRFRLPVCSLAILGDSNQEWRPDSFVSETWSSRFSLHFPNVKLLDYCPQLSHLEMATNPFGPMSPPISTLKNPAPKPSRERETNCASFANSPKDGRKS